MTYRDVPAALDGHACLPPRAHPGDVGFDLAALAGASVPPGELVDIPTGIRLALPDDTWVLLTSRSSTFRRHRLMVLDGVIDSGYRGELFMSVFNLGHDVVEVQAGQRLAQIIPHRNISREYRITPIDPAHFDRLPSSDGRGAAGFGSTG